MAYVDNTNDCDCYERSYVPIQMVKSDLMQEKVSRYKFNMISSSWFFFSLSVETVTDFHMNIYYEPNLKDTSRIINQFSRPFAMMLHNILKWVTQTLMAK